MGSPGFRSCTTCSSPFIMLQAPGSASPGLPAHPTERPASATANRSSGQQAAMERPALSHLFLCFLRVVFKRELLEAVTHLEDAPRAGRARLSSVLMAWWCLGPAAATGVGGPGAGIPRARSQRGPAKGPAQPQQQGACRRHLSLRTQAQKKHNC